MSISEQLYRTRKCIDEYVNGKIIPINNAMILLNEAADTIEALSAKLADMERSEDFGGWIPCNIETLPEYDVLCCDDRGNMILGYAFCDEESETGFSAESEHEYMYNCVKWMEKPKP